MTFSGTLLAHEWIAETGGSENVFEQIRIALPGARAACLWNESPARFPNVEESWLASTPLRGKKALSMPFMGSAWQRTDLEGVDRVVVSSHAFAHHLASRAATSGLPAFAYIHSPARYVWAPELDQRGTTAAARIGRPYFRWHDRRRTSTGVRYAANSAFVARRIAKSWGVQASVLFPPVDIARIRNHIDEKSLSTSDQLISDSLPNEFVFGASRLVTYKNLDAVIDTGELLDLPVVIAGTGPDEERLRAYAADCSVPVIFVGRVSDPLLVDLYRRSSLFVFMAVEDFGIMPVEAMASGTPVLVNSTGGASESLQMLKGGLAIEPSALRSSKREITRLLDHDMRPAILASSALSNASFRDRLQIWLDA